MSNKVGIHQPNYIPWLGYFYKIFESDIFVFLDDVQFSNKGAHNYHYLKTPQGSLRLKIPVEYNHGFKINEVRTKDELDWKKDHLNKLSLNYKKAPYFDEIFEDFKSILSHNYKNISVQNIEIIKFFAKKFKLDSKFVVASDLNIHTSREEKVLDICSATKATIYISGTGAKAYQQEENFIKRNISLKYSAFHPFKYKQLWGEEFLTNVSILDYLMNYGYDWNFIKENFE